MGARVIQVRLLIPNGIEPDWYEIARELRAMMEQVWEQSAPAEEPAEEQEPKPNRISFEVAETVETTQDLLKDMGFRE